MGPTIFLDKSSLQSLSTDELVFLAKHYYPGLPPILVIEILADVKKTSGRKKKRGSDGTRLTRSDAADLARKVEWLTPKVNVHCNSACLTALFGLDVPMTGQILIPGGRELRTKTGAKVVYFEESPEMRVMHLWARNKFSAAEVLLAERWREATRAVDLEADRRALSAALGSLPRFSTIEEVATFVDQRFDDPDYGNQLWLLQRLLDHLGLPQQARDQVFERWHQAGFPPLRQFAPYAAFFLKVYMLFSLCLAQGFVTTRATNRVDLEYLLYLPFCQVFSSGDSLHRDLSRVLLRRDQVFVGRDDLKADLRNLAAQWHGLSDDEKREMRKKYGNYPPENRDSVTYRIWAKLMRPRRGDQEPGLTEEMQAKIMEALRPATEAIEEYRRKKETT